MWMGTRVCFAVRVCYSAALALALPGEEEQNCFRLTKQTKNKEWLL